MNVHFEECWDKTRYESDHVITLHGQEIPYHTVCEDNFFYDHEGKAVATIYYLFLRLFPQRYQGFNIWSRTGWISLCGTI